MTLNAVVSFIRLSLACVARHCYLGSRKWCLHGHPYFTQRIHVNTTQTLRLMNATLLGNFAIGIRIKQNRVIQRNTAKIVLQSSQEVLVRVNLESHARSPKVISAGLF